MSGDAGNIRFGDGATTFKQGDAAEAMYVIRSGKVRMYREQDGRETTLATLKPTEFFGEMALFNAKPRSASAQAVGDTILEPLDKAEFEKPVNGPLVWTMLTRMSVRIREVDEALEKLAVENQARSEHMSNLSVRHSYFV